MSCCNSKRAALNTSVRPQATTPSAAPVVLPVPNPTHVIFAYTGSGLRSIKGAVTGKMYQFAGYGAKVSVDYSDASAMMAEVGLRVLPTK